MNFQIQAFPTPQIFVRGKFPVRTDFVKHVSVSLLSVLVGTPIARAASDNSETGAVSLVSMIKSGALPQSISDSAAAGVALLSAVHDGAFYRPESDRSASAISLASAQIYAPISDSFSDFPNTSAVSLKSVP